MCNCGSGPSQIRAQPIPKAASTVTSNPRTARINETAKQGPVLMPKRTTKIITPIKVIRKNA